MEWITIILISVIIIGIVLAVKSAHENELISEGKALKRGTAFWENSEIFFTSISYTSVLDAVSRTDYSDLKADVYPNANGERAVFWKSSYSWNAKLSWLGEKDGKQVYKFNFTTWKTRNGSPYHTDTMNMMMTRVEKMILALDPEATVETHKMQLKSKTRFF